MALEGRGSGAPAPARTAGEPGSAGREVADVEAPALAGAPARPAAPAPPVVETVTALEKRLAALEEKSKAADASPRSGFSRAIGRMPGGGHLYTSLDDAKEDLALTDSQKADWERALADTERAMDELRKTPDDDGKTYDAMMKEMFEGSGTDGGAMKLDLGKMMSFRNKRIPGRSETYGQADARIKTEAKRRLRDGLSSEQQAKFDKANVDPMLGGGFGPAVMSFAVSSSPDNAPAAPAAPGGR